jgi:ATP-dependent RNA helicase DDX56/DBP9
LQSLLQHSTTAKNSNASRYTSALIFVPTKDLAAQVSASVKSFITFCADLIRCENITRKEDASVTRARLAEHPDLVITTPSRAVQWINSRDLKTENLKWLVVDEADLVLNYGYEDDMNALVQILPKSCQIMMVSATLSTSTAALTKLLCQGREPTILDLASEEQAEEQKLEHYVLPTSEEDKFLLIYAIFKLQLIKGKVIIFVGGDEKAGGAVDRCYRVRLFLEQFGVRSVVLNQEMPVNSRQHVVEEFNRGVYNILLAADEAEVVGNDKRKKRRKLDQDDGEDDASEDIRDPTENAEEERQEGGAEEITDRQSKTPRPRKRHHGDSEFTPTRGIDFRHVTCVLNFDLPTSAKSYIHRTGRTARAGQTGMAVSFYVPKKLYRKHMPTSISQCQYDEEVLESIKTKVVEGGADLKEWAMDWTKLEGFRYRFQDALRSVTRIAVREARTRELRNELINSYKLQRHFEENPQDLKHLRHDNKSTHAVRSLPHLKHVPEYLLPGGGKSAVAKDVGFVGLRRDKENKIRKARAFKKGRGQKDGKGKDPLRSLNLRGRGKK